MQTVNVDSLRRMQRYGLKWTTEDDPITIELTCFKEDHRPENGGLGAYRHLKNAIDLIFTDKNGQPTTKWHDWTNQRLRALCEHKTNAWTGCAAAGKTWDAGLFAMMFWLADPFNTIVVLTSTTAKMVRKRIWPVLRELHRASPALPGHMLDSATMLQTTQGDDKYGIFAKAVLQGSSGRAIADIQGMHAERFMLIVDEATDTPEAIAEVIPNLQKGCADFRLLFIGNALSRLDPHGRVCEPRDGWQSIDVDDDEWETAGVPEWGIEPGVCLHFDGLKSPNLKIGEDKWPFLYSNKDYARDMARPEAKESLAFWKYTRGFWAPDGFCKTVMSEPLVVKYDGMGKFTFMTNSRRVAGLDAGFGGDKCILRIGTIGDIEGGRTAVQLDKKIELIIKASAKEPVHYQIARQVKEHCEREGVGPEAFGLDATGEGGGLASILSNEWSPAINWVEFGGLASDYAISETDGRPAREVYDRKVTELWFSAREFLINGQLKGLDKVEVQQFSSREYTDDKRRIKLDTKDDCKKKVGHSPDEADAVAVLLEVAKRLGTKPTGQGVRESSKVWLEIARKKDTINHEPVEGDNDPWQLEAMDVWT